MNDDSHTTGTGRHPSEVRAKSGPGTEIVLRHLESVGFEGSPRVLRRESDRLVVSWLDGATYFESRPVRDVNDFGRSLGAFLRDLHRALDGLGDTWEPKWAPPPDLRGDQVCHADVTPRNLLLRDGLPFGLIDFEYCCRASPLLDVASGISLLVPRYPAVDDADGVASFRRVVESVMTGYGLGVDTFPRVMTALGAVEDATVDFLAAAQRGLPRGISTRIARLLLRDRSAAVRGLAAVL